MAMGRRAKQRRQESLNFQWDDPHYRPSVSRQRAKEMLYHAGHYMSFPCFADRDSYIAEHGFAAWEQIRYKEQESYNQAQRILLEAMEKV